MGDEGGGTELARQCRLSLLSVVLQLTLALVFVLVSLYAASLLLEPLRILGITTVPPGVAFVEYNLRF
jgi:hypothetical protein